MILKVTVGDVEVFYEDDTSPFSLCLNAQRSFYSDMHENLKRISEEAIKIHQKVYSIEHDQN